MAFQEKVVSLGTTDTLIFECPLTLSGSVHGLVFSNITNVDKNLTLKVYTKSTGTTTTVAANRKVLANAEFAWPKPINMAAGDQIIALTDSLNSVTCLASMYLAVAQPISAGFVLRGTHSVIENYVPNDVVEIDGTSYAAVSPNINNIPPSSAWMRLAGKGATGASATVAVKDEGTSLTSAVTEFNFTGSGATASVIGNTVTVHVPGTTTSLGDLGIPNVQNKSSAMIRSEITSANVTTALGFTPLDAGTLGAPLGPVPLGSDSKIASLYLPSYVDDVLEGTLALFPETGEAGKIYLDTNTGKQYRWSGSTYAEINPSPGSTDAVPEGSANKYFTENRVLASVLSGLSLATNAAISASDTVLSGFGKLQKQLTDLIATVGGKANSNNPTFTGTVNFPSQTANVFFASPNGAAGVPTWRGLVTGDLPALGTATATTINKVAITAPASSATLTIANGKTLTVNNSVALVGTDNSTLNFGAGGTLGTAAFMASTAFAPASASPNYLPSTAIGSSVQAYSATLTSWAGKAVPTGAAVGTTDSQTLTNKTLQGFKEVSATLTGTTPVITGSNGTLVTWNLSGPSTPTTTLADGESVLLKISDGTSFTISWTSVGVVWKDGTVPTLATTGYTQIELWRVGSVIHGAKVGDFAS